MTPPDRQTREILEVTRDNPHLTPKEIAARVGCPRTEVTDVLQRYEDGNAVDRELEQVGGVIEHTGGILAVLLGAVGVGIIWVNGGPEAHAPAFLLGIGFFSLAIGVHRWF